MAHPSTNLHENRSNTLEISWRQVYIQTNHQTNRAENNLLAEVINVNALFFLVSRRRQVAERQAIAKLAPFPYARTSRLRYTQNKYI